MPCVFSQVFSHPKVLSEEPSLHCNGVLEQNICIHSLFRQALLVNAVKKTRVLVVLEQLHSPFICKWWTSDGSLCPGVCSKRWGKQMMKRGHASHRGRFSVAHLTTHLTVSVPSKGGSLQKPAAGEVKHNLRSGNPCATKSTVTVAGLTQFALCAGMWGLVRWVFWR